MNLRLLSAISICVFLLGACAGGAPERVEQYELGGGLVVTVESPGSGEGAGPNDSVRAFTEWTGKTAGPIEGMGGGERVVALDDPNLIEGLRRGLVGIRRGETRRIEIPWRDGYGAQGRPPFVPPREDLVCVVRCVEVIRVGLRDGE